MSHRLRSKAVLKNCALLLLTVTLAGCVYVQLVNEIEAEQKKRNNLEYHENMALQWVKKKKHISPQIMQSIWNRCVAQGDLPTDDDFIHCLRVLSNCEMYKYYGARTRCEERESEARN
jgi:hypothetical protein